jgi:uncharacterized protein (TIGR00255 family)
MITSMTGYGKAIIELPGKNLTIEIKSLNSKQLDISMKLPGAFREKEPEIRTLISQKLERGKIDLFISTEVTGDVMNYSVNKALAKKYWQEIKELSDELNEKEEGSLLRILLNMPDVLHTSKEEIKEEDWVKLRDGIEQTLNQVNEFRTQEGGILENDIRSRVSEIRKLLASVEPFEKSRIEEVRARLQKGFQELSKNESFTGTADPNRFEQELIYYIERLDITEEKVRLEKHCDYFFETLKEPVSQGKKLGFITQEMGREINTTGSKANHAEIQKIVIQMKDELEKVKEQLLNIL